MSAGSLQSSTAATLSLAVGTSAKTLRLPRWRRRKDGADTETV